MFVVVGGFISTSLSVGSLVVDLELKLVFGTCSPKSLYSGSNDYIFEYLSKKKSEAAGRFLNGALN